MDPTHPPDDDDGDVGTDTAGCTAGTSESDGAPAWSRTKVSDTGWRVATAADVPNWRVGPRTGGRPGGLGAGLARAVRGLARLQPLLDFVRLILEVPQLLDRFDRDRVGVGPPGRQPGRNARHCLRQLDTVDRQK